MRRFWERVGEAWRGDSQLIEEWMAPVTEAIAAKLGDYPRIALDVGCGSGSMRLPDRWRVYGVDPAASMLTPGGSVQGKASSLPIEGAAVDAVVSRFAFSLDDNLPAAFAEAYRVLRLGGTITIATWDRRDRNLWASVPETILAERLGIRLVGDEEPSAYRLADPDDARQMMANAGFGGLSTLAVEVPWFATMDPMAAYGMVSRLIGPIRTMLDRVEPAQKRETETAITDALESADRIGRAWVIHGVREARDL